MTCTYCDAPTPPGVHLCHTCVNQLIDTLDQIPDALDIATDTVAKLDSRDHGGGGSGKPSSTEPVNLDASAKRTALWEHVVSWSRWVLAEDQRAEKMPSDPAIYLQWSVPIIRRHDWAGDLLAELSEHLGKVMRSVDIPADVIHLGRCGAVVEGRPCPGEIRATKGRATTTCRACGATHDVQAIQQNRVDAAWHVQGTLSEVVKALNLLGWKLKQRTADQWVTRGKLRTPWQRTDGARLYTPAQVREVMVEQEQRSRRRRVA